MEKPSADAYRKGTNTFGEASTSEIKSRECFQGNEDS